LTSDLILVAPNSDEAIHRLGVALSSHGTIRPGCATSGPRLVIVPDVTQRTERWVAKLTGGSYRLLLPTRLGLCISPLFGRGRKPCARCFFSRVRATGVGLDGTSISSGIAVLDRLRDELARPELDATGVARIVAADRVTRHAVLRRPSCKPCARADIGVDWRGEPLEVALHSRLSGIVRSLFRASRQRPVMPLEAFGALLSDTRPTLGHGATTVTGGHAADARRALNAALGEAAERYSRSWVPRRVHLDTARNLGSTAVHPASWEYFTDRQYADPAFPYRRFTEDTPVYWMEARSLHTANTVLVPAQVVLRHSVRLRGDTPVLFSHTTGTACAREATTAEEHALDEILERDALMILWRNQLQPPRISTSEAAATSALEVVANRAVGFRLSVADLSDIPMVPVVLAEFRDARGRTFAGSAAGPTIERAIERAIAELAACANNLIETSLRAPTRRSDLRTFDDHKRYYLASSRRSRVHFVMDGPLIHERSDRYDVPAERYRGRLRAAFAIAGIEAFMCDITPPDIADLGLTVMRAVSPNACAMEGDDRAPALGFSRLRRVPERLSWPTRPRWARGAICTIPHPF
jgi:ribosomal protein S12 methylthiotransferase accessory factor